MSDDDNLFNMYGNAPDRYQHESLPEYDQRHASGPATPYTGIPERPGNAPYVSAPRTSRRRRTWKERRQAAFDVLLTIVFLLVVGFIATISIKAGIAALVLWVVIASIIRRWHKRRRNR